MSDVGNYNARLLAYTEGRDPISMQREVPDLLADLISGVDHAKLTTPPAPGKWSVGEILAHLAEDELTSTWRYRQMIESPGVAIAAFDQDLWAQFGDYASRTPADALQMFRLLRVANLRLLAAAYARTVGISRRARRTRSHHRTRSRPAHGRTRSQSHRTDSTNPWKTLILGRISCFVGVATR